MSSTACVLCLRQARNTGASLIETFTAEDINVHINICKLRTGARGRAHGADPEDSHAGQACPACDTETLTFEPPSMCCTLCGERIRTSNVRYQCVCNVHAHQEGLPLPYPSTASARKGPYDCL